jgi:hypothetical protein
MRKLALIVAVLAFIVAPGLAEAGGFGATGFEASLNTGLSTNLVLSFWRPFFYAGPLVYGYPAAFGFAYPGPYVSEGDASVTSYTYGYPGPYTYGVYGYLRPACSTQLDGSWVCS